MADQKISELTALTGANVADDDAIAIVDTSATETKKIVFSELKNALDTATGFVRITGDTMTGNLSMGDNVKAIFGAGSDLQIYHNPTGSHSYITESGGGSLYIQGTELNLTNSAGTSTYANFVDGGAAFIRHAGSTKLATTSTGVDITGTLISDGLTVDGGTYHKVVSTFPSTYATNLLIGQQFNLNNDALSDTVTFAHTGVEGVSDFIFTVAGNKKLNIAGNGDISFYEDTGTTPKFFWDASTERLGIGTASPNTTLDITTASNTNGFLLNVIGTAPNYMFDVRDDGTSKFRIDSSGNVGIGLTPENSDGTWRNFEQGGMNLAGRSAGGADGMIGTNYVFKTNNSEVYKTTAGTSRIFFDANELRFQQAASGTAGTAISWSEAMRIDSSGNVGIGDSSPEKILHVSYASASTSVNKTASALTDPVIVIENLNDASGNYSGIQFSGSGSASTDTVASSAIYGFNESRGGTYPYGYMTFYTTNSGGTHAEAMRIDSSGNVGIGTSSPSSYSSAANNLVVQDTAGEGGITIVSTNTGSSNIFFADTDAAVQGQIKYQHSGDYMRFYTAASEAMRINSSGNVGIGTSSPTAVSGTTVLEITGTSGSAGAEVIIGSADTTATGSDLFGGLAFKSIDSNGTPPHYSGIKARAADTYGGASLEFYAGRSNYESNDPRFIIEGPQSVSGEAMRIDSSGNLLVGTTINPNSAAYLGMIVDGNAKWGRAVQMANTTGVNAEVFFNNSGTVVGSINISTTATAYNTSSDYRLKENVVDLTGATTRLKQLGPKRFNFIADADTTVDGFLAHEAQAVVPEAVTGTKDAMRDEEYEVTPAVLDDDGNVVTEAIMGTRSVPDYQGIDQSKLVPLLVATIKELEARITALENA